uniref:Toxin candidate TRINITY_DN40582_c2_g2_i12 n=1 Tax=Pachycerianthus maua TaxID=2736681 RepID=A0A7G7WZ20_9CNID|nr:toxin candidate TRINITY_DN40582_c2_g2_i12 [Pachycerianthus maua]
MYLFQMQSHLMIIAVFCTTMCLLCCIQGLPEGRPSIEKEPRKEIEKEGKHEDTNPEFARNDEVTYEVLVEDYKKAQKEQCKSLEELDGCSAPFGQRSFFYRDIFTPACLRHDVCYRCGNHYKWTRDECDVAFRRDMRQLCEADSTKRSIFTKLGRCHIAANVYYNGVKAFGNSSFEKNPKDWCKLDCSRRGGDPSYTKQCGKKIDDLFAINELNHGQVVSDEAVEFSGDDEEKEEDEEDEEEEDEDDENISTH